MTTAPTMKAPKVKMPSIAGLNKPTAATPVYLSAPEHILGLDMSLEHTGWCLTNLKTGETTQGVFEPNPNKSKKVVQILGMKRLVWLREHVLSMARYGVRPEDANCAPPRIACLVLIEGYAFGAKGSSGISLGELGGVTRLALWDEKIPYIEVPPTQVKKFITGKGGAQKDIVLKEVFKRYGADFDDNNIADAFALAQLGRAITNTHEKDLVVAQKEVVADVVKTYFKDHPVLAAAA